ncbi:MAG TPA: MFS transporter [Casimicrobiaceae bacterium]|nr:MFS transporter [Casimicrobiaceae bacterium]
MLTQLATRYGSFLRQPHVTVLLVTALITRMPLGTVGFSMLMHLRDISGSFATAGTAGGTYLASSALFAPVLGRIIDRNGPRVPLLVCAIVCPLALLLIVFARPLQLGLPTLTFAAAVAGAFAPPITVLMRTIWRYRFTDEHDRRIAYAVDAVLVELAFTLGPALIGVLLAIATPSIAFAVAWVFMAIAVPVFAASPAMRYWKHEPGVERHLLGPLTEPRLLVVYLVTALLTFSLGMLEVGYPGFATAAGAPALAGMLLAINSSGSALGGLAYGGLHIARPVERQLRASLLLLAIPLALHIPVTAMSLLAVLAFAAGLFIAPSLAAATMLVSSNAPSRYATEAFTWSATFIIAGVGAGMAFAGQLLERTNANTVFGAAAVAALVAASAALALRPR